MDASLLWRSNVEPDGADLVLGDLRDRIERAVRE